MLLSSISDQVNSMNARHTFEWHPKSLVKKSMPISSGAKAVLYTAWKSILADLHRIVGMNWDLE